jgi:hypothetical protein
MTERNADDLSGRALDAAIARVVFELEVEERTNTRTRVQDWVCREPGKQWLRIPYYSASLTASVRVELELQKRGWKRQEVRTGSHWNEPGGVRVILEHTDGRTVGAFGHPDEALCRAALTAVQQS